MGRCKNQREKGFKGVSKVEMASLEGPRIPIPENRCLKKAGGVGRGGGLVACDGIVTRNHAEKRNRMKNRWGGGGGGRVDKFSFIVWKVFREKKKSIGKKAMVEVGEISKEGSLKEKKRPRAQSQDSVGFSEGEGSQKRASLKKKGVLGRNLREGIWREREKKSVRVVWRC